MTGCSPWALVLAARAHETILTFAGSLAIVELALSLAAACDAIVLGTGCVTSLAKETSGTRASSFATLECAATMTTACNFALGLCTTRAVVLAACTDKATFTSAFGSGTVGRGALSVTVADVAIFVGLTLHLTLVTGEALLAHALRLLAVRIHEAGTIVRADLTILGSRAFCATFLAHESLLALAHSGSFVAFLLANTSVRTTTYTSEWISSALECAVASHETLTAQALTSRCTTWHTLTLSRANTSLVILGAGGLALVAKETLLALAECDLLDFVVHAGTMPTAHAVFGSTGAACIARLPFPWACTFAFRLSKPVEGAFTILAAHLFT